MKMRELEKRTGVRREMIHHYLRQGLLPEPVKPKPNVADYGEEHVRGILALRKLQTERRLSLSEIKQVLDGNGSAVSSDAAAFPHFDELFAASLGADESLVELSSVLDRNPHAEKDAQMMQRLGAIQIERREGRSMLSRLDAQIVGIWGDMRAAGFTEEEGWDAGVVSIYVQAAKDMAAAEIHEFVTRFGDRYSTEKQAELAQFASGTMMGLFALLRMKGELNEFRKSGL
jgi:DNA-binding transcriptional MerR regulator